MLYNQDQALGYWQAIALSDTEAVPSVGILKPKGMREGGREARWEDGREGGNEEGRERERPDCVAYRSTQSWEAQDQAQLCAVMDIFLWTGPSPRVLK